MRKLLFVMLMLTASVAAWGQSGQYSVLRPRVTTPASCVTTEGAIYWDVVALELKVCTATNTWTGVSGSGHGTVTSVGETFVGGLISVAGSPITTSGTFALTVAGTSGGIPYFGSSSSWSSSGVLTLGMPVLGGGAGNAPTVGTISGNTTKFATTTGTLTNGDCVAIDADGNFVDAGVPGCGGGGGGGSVTSVAFAAPTGFPVSGSPIVGAGTLSFAMPTGWTTGSLLLGDGSNSAATLPIGTSGTILTSDGTTASWGPASSVGPGTVGKYAIFSTTTAVGNSAFLLENGTQPVASANFRFPFADSAAGASTINAAAALNQRINLTSGSFLSSISNATTGEMEFLHYCADSTASNAGLNGLGASLLTGNLKIFSRVPVNTCSHIPVWFNPDSKWDLAAEPHIGLTALNNGGSFAAVPAIQYVSPSGNDTADGLRESTPVASILQALLNLSQLSNPKAGTIYVVNGAYLSSYTGEGLYLMGASDPGYAACNISGWPCLISGKHWMKWNSARIIGLGGSFETNADQPATELVCGAGSACNTVAGPILAFSAVTTVVMENIKLTGPASGPTMTWGIGSNGARTTGGSNSVFRNLQVGAGNFAARGPAIDIGGNTFELIFENLTAGGNSAEIYPLSTCVRTSNVVTCTISSGTFSSYIANGEDVWLNGGSDKTITGGRHLLTTAGSTSFTFPNLGPNSTSNGGSVMSKGHWSVRLNAGSGNSGSFIMKDSHLNTGGISYTAGSTNWLLYVENTYTENQPNNSIGIAVDEVATPGNMNLVNFFPADNGPGSLTCMDIKSAGNTIWYPTQLSDSTLAANSGCYSGGTLLQSYPGGYQGFTSSPDVFHEVGFIHNHVIGQTDASRLNFSPTIVRHANVAAQLPTWGSTNVTLTTVPGPDGIPNAAGQAAASPNGGVTFGAISATYAAGDILVAGVWEAGVGASVLSTIPAQVFQSSGSCSLTDFNGNPGPSGMNPGTSANFEGYLAGDGQWVWEAHAYKIYGGGACTYRFQGLINSGKTLKYAYPVFFRIPAGTYSSSDIAQLFVEYMNTYPDTASAGDVTMERKQRFSMSDPQSNFFMKMTTSGSGLTADRILSWPDIAGTVGVVTGSTPANNDCAKFVVTGSVVSLTTDGAACGAGGAGTPGGTDTAVQFNHPLGTFAGDATNFNFDATTHKLTTTGDVAAANLDLTAGGVVSSADTGTPSITFSSSAVAISGTGSPADFVSIPVYTAGPPAIVSVEAAGSDTDVSLNLVSKGTGQVLANGVPINTNTWLYVTNYGAVGNSSTGDDVTLQTAIDACPATGCTLFFPAGTYYVAGTNATITNVAQSLFSATFTATNSFTVGDYVTVSGMSDGTLNGLWRITSRTGSQFVASGAISQTVASGAMSGTATRGLMARTPFIELKGVGFPGRDTGAPSMIKSTTGANPMYLLAIWPMASANGPKISQLGFQDNTTTKVLMGGLLIVNSNSLEVDNNLFFNFTCGGKTEGTDVGYGCGTGLTLSGGGDTGQTTGYTQWGTIYNNSMFLDKRGIATRANVASITFLGNNIQCYLTASPVAGSIGMDFGDTFGRNYSASALGVPSEMVITGTQIQNCDVGLAGYNLHHGVWAGKAELLGAVIGRASTIGARIDGTSTSLTGYADLNWASVGYDKGISVVANARQLNIIKQSMTSNTLDLSVSDDAVSIPLTGFGYTANKVAQTAAITDTAMQASTSIDKTYKFDGVINCTVVDATATATLNLKYFDTSNTAQTVSVTATCAVLGAASVGAINTLIRQINGHSITYGVTIANSPTYDVSVRLEQK